MNRTQRRPEASPPSTQRLLTATQGRKYPPAERAAAHPGGRPGGGRAGERGRRVSEAGGAVPAGKRGRRGSAGGYARPAGQCRREQCRRGSAGGAVPAGQCRRRVHESKRRAG